MSQHDATGLSVIDENTKSDWLPDFGAPVATRDRAEWHEPTGAVHYSDTEDEEEHKRRDFVHSNAAHFRIGYTDIANERGDRRVSLKPVCHFFYSKKL